MNSPMPCNHPRCEEEARYYCGCPRCDREDAAEAFFACATHREEVHRQHLRVRGAPANFYVGSSDDRRRYLRVTRPEKSDASAPGPDWTRQRQEAIDVMIALRDVLKVVKETERIDSVLHRLMLNLADRTQTALKFFSDTAVPLILYCPKCGGRHIDEGEFASKPHHTHACQHCGMVWRPAVLATVGVQFLPGFKNGDAA